MSYLINKFKQKLKIYILNSIYQFELIFETHRPNNIK